MSLEQILAVWDADVKDAKQQILLVLANAADQYGNNVYPSMAYVAWRANVAWGTVKRIFRELRKDEVLILVRRGSQRPGARRTNEYRLDLSKLPRKLPVAEWCLTHEIPYFLLGDPELPSSYPPGDLTFAPGDRGSLEGADRGDHRSPKTKGGNGKKEESGSARARGERRATPVPPDFPFTDEMRHWARENVPNLSVDTIRRETQIFHLKMLDAGRLSFDWFASWCVFILRKSEWVAKDGTPADARLLPFGDPDSQSPPSQFKPPDRNCPRCYGQGMEIVPGKGARRCRCRLLQPQDGEKEEGENQ